MKDGLQIYIDLDGTILDNSRRHYEVYHSTYHWLSLKPLTYNVWLEKTRNGELLLPGETKVAGYTKMFQENFELPYYLQIDKMFPDMRNVIAELDHFNDISVVTLRGDSKAAAEQIRRYANVELEVLSEYPDTISIKAFVETKKKLILSKTDTPSGCIIGDTEYEILVGKELGLRTIAVTWGARNGNFLEKYNPDIIIDRPYDILDAIWMMRKC